MPRVKKGRRSSNPCGTCLLVCFIVVVVLVIGIIVGSVVAFNSFVSPLIGGVKFGDCMRILSAIRHSDRDKIINKDDEFSIQDLNDFYVSLNSMLYQKDMTEEEYLTRYEALTEEERANMTFEEYKEANPYRIDINVLSNALNLNDLISGKNDNDEIPEVVASGEVEDSNGEIKEAEDNQNSEVVANLIKEMYFDFSALGKYPYLQDEEDFSYTTFEITGKQLASVINEIMDIVLNAFDLGEQIEDFKNVNLKDYLGIPVVSFKNVENKDKLVITVEFKIKQFINEVMANILIKQMNVPRFAVKEVASLFPKNFYVTLETFPTDSDSEINLRINHANEKTSNNIKIIVNALTERFNFQLFPSENNDENENTQQVSTNLFKQINDKVVDIFSLINDYVPINFVPDEEGSSTLRIAHIQSLLKLTGLFDEDDLENSITPHMFFTTLRCLFDEASSSSNKEALTSLYAQLDAKYGINQDYWVDRSLLDSETLQNITSQINVAEVQFKENEQMKVYVHDGQLTTLIDDAVKNGLFSSSDSEVSAAGEENENQNDILSLIDFEAVRITKSNSQKLSIYEKDEKQYSNVIADFYKIDATISLTLSDFFNLNSNEEENEENNPIIETLTRSLPQKLCLALVLNIKDVFDSNGDLIDRIVGADVLPTTFKINNFDENYSKKVFDIITLMVSKFNSDFNLDIDSITSQIESSFENVFTTVSNNLYCNIEFSEKDENNAHNGCLVLPSVYEVVYGLQKKEIENSDTLTENDELSKSEIKDLFVQIYNTPFLVLDYNQTQPDDTSGFAKVLRKYNPSEGSEFLGRLSRNYYFKNPLNSESLFGDEQIDFSASSFVFKGENGLYHDQRSIDELDTALSGGSLASIINEGINLAELISNDDGNNSLIKSLSIVNCTYEWSEEVLFLNFEFEACLKDSEEENKDNGDNSGISLNSFLPEKAYLTASIVLYTDNENNLYNTELRLNNGSIENISKLAKIFSGGDFETDTLNNQVKESLSKTFDSVKKIFNLKYVMNSDDAVVFKNVFNTINKLSHPDSDTDEDKHNDYLAYESLSDAEKEADDEALRARLMEFGRSPDFTTTSEYDNENEVKIVNNVTDLIYFSNAQKDIYSLSDIDSFFEDLNNDFYISDDNLLNADNITELNSISSSFIDFSKLYNDERNISDINLIITGNRFTALANKFTDYSISLDFASTNSDSEQSNFGSAKIVQSKFGIEEDISYIEIVILVEITSEDEILSALLPSHIFLTAKLNLTQVDENGKNTYPIDLYINNFTQTETDDAMRRINLLESALGFESGFSLDTVKSNLSEQIGSVLDSYSSIFDGFNVKNDYIALPNVFEYFTNGTIEPDGSYNTQKPMLETFVSGSSKCVYGIENGKVGYYENNNFILVNAIVDGNSTVATAVRNENNVWGYYDRGEFVTIQTLPEELMNDLRSFGRLPNETKVSISQGSKLGYSILTYVGSVKFVESLSENLIELYQPYGLSLSSEKDYFLNQITDGNGTYYHNTASEILDLLNTNFYICEDKKIDSSSLVDENTRFTLDNSMFSFESLYKDTRTFEDTMTTVSGSAFASVIHDIYPNGFKSADNDDYSANIVQMHIYTKELSENTNNLLNGYSTLKTIFRVKLSNSALGDTNILPDYIYLTVFTVIDPDAGHERFQSEVVINNFGYLNVNTSISEQIDSTNDFINRLNVLKNNFNVEFDFDLDEIKGNLRSELQTLFDDNLQAFGNIKFENDSLIIPNLFQFLCDGQIADDGNEKLTYYYGEEVLDDGTVIDHRMYEPDGTLTNPETLRSRLKELGNDTYEGAILIRGTTNEYYNDNAFTIDDENQFYSDMQAYYFLQNKPSFNDLQNSSILNNLTTDIENVFNLHGKANAVYGDDIKQNYIDFGLYNYLGEQAKLKLSDKALASLIGSQNTIDLTSNMMLESLVITSVKLEYKDDFNMTIEITIKATTRSKIQSELNAMPDYFYLTTITDRTVQGGNIDYSTRIGINGFSPDEFDKVLVNIAHIEQYTSLGISRNFKTEDISNGVEKALRETLDEKLSEYLECFGSYEESSDLGVGYIQFKSVYSEILNALGVENGSEEDIQKVIVKLNNDNEYLSKNKYDDSNALSGADMLTRKYITDREFAHMLNDLLKSDASTEYITVEQLVILKGVNSEYDGYESLLKNIDPSFALTNEDAGYFIITVSINTSKITSNVKLAPETIHISLLMDSNGNFVKYNNATDEISFKFIQDFTASEQDLFMSIINDETNSINVDSLVESKVHQILNWINGEFNQSDNFDEYCGYVGNK